MCERVAGLVERNEVLRSERDAAIEDRQRVERQRDEARRVASSRLSEIHKAERERDELREKFNEQWKIVRALEADDE